MVFMHSSLFDIFTIKNYSLLLFGFLARFISPSHCARLCEIFWNLVFLIYFFKSSIFSTKYYIIYPGTLYFVGFNKDCPRMGQTASIPLSVINHIAAGRAYSVLASQAWGQQPGPSEQISRGGPREGRRWGQCEDKAETPPRQSSWSLMEHAGPSGPFAWDQEASYAAFQGSKTSHIFAEESKGQPIGWGISKRGQQEDSRRWRCVELTVSPSFPLHHSVVTQGNNFEVPPPKTGKTFVPKELNHQVYR